MAGIGTYMPIKIYKISSTQDANGDMVENTTLLFTAWASVEDIGGSSTLQNGKTNLQDTKRFKFRFRENMILTSEYIIQYYGKIYAISNVQRINEKRFNYLVIGTGTYNTLTTVNTVFPNGTPVGGGGGGTNPPVATNWTSANYDQTLGGITLAGGSIDSNWTTIEFFKYPYDGSNYLNAYGEAISTSAFPGDEPFGQGDTNFTPGQVLIRWRRVSGTPPFAPITPIQEQVLTITRLSRRYINVMKNYGNFGQLAQNAFPFRVYDVNNTFLGIANNANQFISLMNGSAANQACFTVVSDASDSGGMKFYVDPVAPYQSWNFGPPLYFYAGQI